jgi:hypothetical protein
LSFSSWAFMQYLHIYIYTYQLHSVVQVLRYFHLFIIYAGEDERPRRVGTLVCFGLSVSSFGIHGDPGDHRYYHGSIVSWSESMFSCHLSHWLPTCGNLLNLIMLILHLKSCTLFCVLCILMCVKTSKRYQYRSVFLTFEVSKLGVLLQQNDCTYCDIRICAN